VVKTNYYAIIITDIFNEVDNSTWIYMPKQMFQWISTEVLLSFHQ